MAVATIPVPLPEPLYRRLENAAAVAHRTIDDLLAQTLTVALPPAPDLPETLANELAEMIWLTDDALWSATVPSFMPDQQNRLVILNGVEDERALTPAEKAEQAKLLSAYERSLLRRAQAFAILARRGYRIPTYAELTPPA